MEKNKIKGILVIYLDVGLMSAFKAESFVERIKERINEKSNFLNDLKEQGIETMFIPVRPDSITRVEMLNVTDECIPIKEMNLDKEKLQELFGESVE